MESRSIPVQLGLFVLACLAAATGPVRAGFTIQDLGVISGAPGTSGESINAGGQVAGVATIGADIPYSAVKAAAQGQFNSVVLPSYAGTSAAYGINANGDIGGMLVDTRDQAEHGFFTSNGSVTELGQATVNGIKGSFTQVNGINDSGQVVGTAGIPGRVVNGVYQAGTNQGAFRSDSSGNITLIQPLGTGLYSVGNGINNSGTIVGTSETSPNGILHPFLSALTGPVMDLTARNAAGSFSTNIYGNAINKNGDVVGDADVGNSDEHAFFASHNGGALQDLGVIESANSSIAHGVNNSGFVVGELDFGNGGSRAFIFDPTPGVGMVNLNSLLSPADQANVTLLTATSINDGDQITGTALINGQMHGYVLTPNQDPALVDPVAPALVPEPPAVVLAAIGLAIAAAGSRLGLRRGRTGDRAASGPAGASPGR